MKQIFDNYIDNSFDGVREQAYFKIQQFEINYKRFFPKDTQTQVLDIGVGRGEMLTCMKQWGYNYLGVDITKSTVDYCRSIELSCDYTENTISWLNEKKNTYQVITLLDVIEHIPKQEVIYFLKAIHDALLPGGCVIIQTPNMQAHDPNLHRYNDFTHEFGLTEHSFKQILRESGFQNFSFYGFEWMVGNRIKHKVGKFLRFIHNKIIYISRRLSGNLNPTIVHPIFFAVGKK